MTDAERALDALYRKITEAEQKAVVDARAAPMAAMDGRATSTTRLRWLVWAGCAGGCGAGRWLVGRVRGWSGCAGGCAAGCGWGVGWLLGRAWVGQVWARAVGLAA
ncbi:hypothetical protein AB0A95_21250 [Micromonospora sp. NPDC049230]|uniref:hypothetical protein n=1 Tax=Micromonospora sp. NPDC049230 TaxID=3155502 RepID=UPI0033C5AD0A